MCCGLHVSGHELRSLDSTSACYLDLDVCQCDHAFDDSSALPMMTPCQTFRDVSEERRYQYNGPMGGCRRVVPVTL